MSTATESATRSGSCSRAGTRTNSIPTPARTTSATEIGRAHLFTPRRASDLHLVHEGCRRRRKVRREAGAVHGLVPEPTRYPRRPEQLPLRRSEEHTFSLHDALLISTWFRKDVDGDGKCDEKRELFTGWYPNQLDTHAGPNNFRYGDRKSTPFHSTTRF